MDGITKDINEKDLGLFVKIGRAFKSLKWYEILMCIIMLAISVYYAIEPQEGTPQWLAVINFISGLCGIICIFFCAKANRMNFPFAMINTVVFAIYLGYFGIWATFWLEVIIYMPLNIYSWINWYRHKDNDDNLLAKSKVLKWWQHLIVAAVITALTVLVYYALDFLAGDTWMRFAARFNWNVTVMKWIDAAIFAIGIVASTLEALRYKAQYGWWIITDIIAVAQYVLKGDPVYVTKKAIYLIEAFIGFANWTRLAKKNTENE